MICNEAAQPCSYLVVLFVQLRWCVGLFLQGIKARYQSELVTVRYQPRLFLARDYAFLTQDFP